MANRLAQETSPYLLEHANNPVDWYPWGSQALERARTEHKPILLSIGYSACHWCHVMARESFEDPQTAALMNRDFVSIKVDREERPDLDQVYMRAVQGMTGSGGWPMTVFLLPDGTPFFAGTYFPPSDRFGMPAFQRVLAAVADAFARRPADVEETAAQVRDFLHRPSVPLAAGELTPALLDEAAAQLARDFDAAHAGFGGAPKFPQPMLVEVLLRHHVRTGQPAALEMARQTLRAMTSADGAFYSSLDADSEGEEGRFYLWTPAELEAVLGIDAARALADAFDVTAPGNFEGRNILHPVTPEAIELLDGARGRLMAARAQRARPHRDEKVIAGWNGLMLRAVADAGRVLDRQDLVIAAEANARFLLSRMREGGRMRRSYKEGRAPLAGFLEDQAAVADGVLSVYEATFDPRWLEEIRSLVAEMLAAFWDEEAAAFFDTAKDQERLVVRPQDVTDNAIPSGTSLAVAVLLRAGMLLGEPSWTDRARSALERLAPTAAKAPLAFGHLLTALDFHLGRVVELAVIAPPGDPQADGLLDVVRERYLPNHLLAVGASDPGIPLLADRRAIDGKATAYLCEHFVCQAPTQDPGELARQLDAFRAKPVASRARRDTRPAY